MDSITHPRKTISQIAREIVERENRVETLADMGVDAWSAENCAAILAKIEAKGRELDALFAELDRNVHGRFPGFEDAAPGDIATVARQWRDACHARAEALVA